MQLTHYTDYSLRLLLYLTLHPDGATITEVAEAYGISRNHLVRIVHDLGTKGRNQTERGRGGGIKLAHAPETVGLGAVVRDLEPHFNLVECFDEASDGCVISDACVLKHALARARDAFLAELDGFTLADLARNANRLKKLLHPVPGA